MFRATLASPFCCSRRWRSRRRRLPVRDPMRPFGRVGGGRRVAADRAALRADGRADLAVAARRDRERQAVRAGRRRRRRRDRRDRAARGAVARARRGARDSTEADRERRPTGYARRDGPMTPTTHCGRRAPRGAARWPPRARGCGLAAGCASERGVATQESIDAAMQEAVQRPRPVADPFAVPPKPIAPADGRGAFRRQRHGRRRARLLHGPRRPARAAT